MNLKNLTRNGLVLIALSMPVFTSCRQSPPSPDETTSRLSLRASEAERQAREAKESLEKRNQEYEELKKERDEFSRKSQYPTGTPEDVIVENKKFKNELLRYNITHEVGTGILINMLEEARKNRKSIFELTKEVEIRKAYEESKGVYLDMIKGKELDTTENPLYIEKAEHAATKAKLDYQKAETERVRARADADKARYDTYFDKITTERNAWMNRAKSLENSFQNPNQR